MRKHTVTYAQNREDLILSCFFDENEKGFYVDVGANDPAHESVTMYFYDRGWHGINVEPIPKMHRKLAAQRPRDINLAVGAGKAPDTVTLHYYPEGDGLSTMSDTMASGYETKPTEFTRKEQQITVEVLPLETIFKRHVKTGTIQFMKVDVEGFEYEVLAGNDWKKYRPEVICIEANHVDKDWRPLLAKQNYALVFTDGLNEYYADKGTDRAEKFDYVKGVIFKEPIVNFRLLKDFEEYDERVTALEKNNTELGEELQKSQAERQRLEVALNEILPLRRHVKRNVKRSLSRVDRKIQRTLTNENNFEPTEIMQEPGTPEERLKLARTADRDGFARYNEPPKNHPVLPAYQKARSLIRKPGRN